MHQLGPAIFTFTLNYFYFKVPVTAIHPVMRCVV